jgi:tRNA (cytidine/uridine-2'-O-)-methyltransferase
VTGRSHATTDPHAAVVDDSQPSAPPLVHIVLLHPEIPNNTGNIGRTAAALGCRLHIIHPIGFDMDEKARRRAGLDYWHLVDCVEHASWEAFLERERPARIWGFSARTARNHFSAGFARGDYLLFGRESTGFGTEIASWITSRFGEDRLVSIPMPGGDGVRSLNLATAVAIAGYEALRQITRTDAAPSSGATSGATSGSASGAASGAGPS